MKKSPTVIPVVAAALIDRSGRILMQRRRLGRAFAGLWEFPGGKIEAGESPEVALLREIEEELGVRLAREALEPISFASDPERDPALRQPHLILLYACREWQGEPAAIDADSIGWFNLADAARLPMPPLDVPLVKALQCFSEGRSEFA